MTPERHLAGQLQQHSRPPWHGTKAGQTVRSPCFGRHPVSRKGDTNCVSQKQTELKFRQVLKATCSFRLAHKQCFEAVKPGNHQGRPSPTQRQLDCGPIVHPHTHPSQMSAFQWTSHLLNKKHFRNSCQQAVGFLKSL